MLGYELLSSYPNISHFVTSRCGGCSQGAYDSFNCSPFAGDDAERVDQNQQLLLATLPQHPCQLIIPFQTHGTTVRCIDKAFLAASACEQQQLLDGVDALITREAGCCLCISTADCVPILLYDPVHQAIGAVHAGWRGTVNHILTHTLEQMHNAFGTEGKHLLACIGPSISMESFEVGNEVYEAFCLKGFQMPLLSMWNAATQKHHIDLNEANRQQLLAFGVSPQQIESAAICTYIHHQQFFSARRLGIKSGRILSGINLLR